MKKKFQSKLNFAALSLMLSFSIVGCGEDVSQSHLTAENRNSDSLVAQDDDAQLDAETMRELGLETLEELDLNKIVELQGDVDGDGDEVATDGSLVPMKMASGSGKDLRSQIRSLQRQHDEIQKKRKRLQFEKSLLEASGKKTKAVKARIAKIVKTGTALKKRQGGIKARREEKIRTLMKFEKVSRDRALELI